MRLTLATLALAALTTTPVFAEITGDPVKGEAVFKQCQTCHVVADADGNVLAGRNGKIGPNLHDLDGRHVGSLEGFKYGKDIAAVGESGLIWDEALFVEYVQDPAKFLKAKLDKSNAATKMSFKLKKPEDAADVYAYIASFNSAPAEGAVAPSN